MRHHFGFWTLTLLVVANMIGTGVFTTSGFSLADLGTPSVVLLAWLAGGLIAVCGAIGYGQLSRAMPESGGEYLFLSRAAHPLLGFVAGWVSLIAGFSGAIAFAATGLEEYLLPDSIRPEQFPQGVLAVGSIIAAGLLHGVRVRTGAALQNSVVILKLGLLAVLLGVATRALSAGSWEGTAVTTSAPVGWELAAAFAGSLVWISLSYSGFNAAVYVADEVEGAEETVPRALVTGTVLVTVLYLLLNAVFLYAPAAESIVGRADVAAIAARVVGGTAFETFVRGTIAVCLLTSVFSMMLAAPRVYAKMADDGFLPRALRSSDEGPRVAIGLQVAIAVLLVLASDLRGLLDYLGLTLSISAACSVCCLFLPGVRRERLLHPAHIAPALFVVGTLIAAGMRVASDPQQVIGTAVTFGVGAVAYLLTVRRRPRKA